MSERQGVPKMTDPTGSTGRGRLADVLAMRAGRAEPEPPFVIEQREALGFEEGSLDRVGVHCFSFHRRGSTSSATRSQLPRSVAAK